MTLCRQCGKDLSTVDEIHSVEGMLFCSKLCAVAHKASSRIAAANAEANKWYNDCAEAISPSDIGLVKYTPEQFGGIRTCYAQNDDITFILKGNFVGDRFIGEEVIGFYYGEPDMQTTLKYVNQALEATLNNQ